MDITKTVAKMTEEKAIDMLNNLLKQCDAYVTAKQSEVVLEAVKELHNANYLDDSTYIRSLKSIIVANGFELYGCELFRA